MEPTKQQVRILRSHLQTENERYDDHFQLIPRQDWPSDRDQRRIYVWRSNRFLVQAFDESLAIRLTVNRTMINKCGQWLDGITWDDLQRIKRRVGYGDCYAVEIYPADGDMVNEANMRHLWILPEPLNIGWFKEQS